MGYAILNRLIGLVIKALKMGFFQENFYFHNLSLVLDQWRPKKRTSLKEDSNWIDILKPRSNSWQWRGLYCLARVHCDLHPASAICRRQWKRWRQLHRQAPVAKGLNSGILVN